MVALQDQHAVAVAEEAVSGLDGVFVGGEDEFPARFGSNDLACEGADQHEQGGLREMEVGEEAGDDAETVSRADEDAGLAGVGLKLWNPHLRIEMWGTQGG